MVTNHWILLWDNWPVGLDSDSGGYPYKTNSPNAIKYWTTAKDARNYLDIITSHGKSTQYNLIEVREVEFRLKKIKK